MEIKSTLTNRSGETFNVTYKEGDPLQDLEGKVLDGVHIFCFYKGKLVVVYAESKEYWTPPGGAIEPGETFEEASIREVKEESNMKVLHQECIGYQDLERVGDGIVFRQFRMFAIVEPYGDFVSDPDGDITEIKLIDAADYKDYIKWGEIGDRLMERALEMKKKYESNT